MGNPLDGTCPLPQPPLAALFPHVCHSDSQKVWLFSVYRRIFGLLMSTTTSPAPGLRRSVPKRGSMHFLTSPSEEPKSTTPSAPKIRDAPSSRGPLSYFPLRRRGFRHQEVASSPSRLLSVAAQRPRRFLPVDDNLPQRHHSSTLRHGFRLRWQAFVQGLRRPPLYRSCSKTVEIRRQDRRTLLLVRESYNPLIPRFPWLCIQPQSFPASRRAPRSHRLATTKSAEPLPRLFAFTSRA